MRAKEEKHGDTETCLVLEKKCVLTGPLTITLGNIRQLSREVNEYVKKMNAGRKLYTN